MHYTTYFIGTRKDFDPAHEPYRAGNGDPVRVTHRYSDSIGTVLAKVEGISPSYTYQGDEIYVRAKVVSTKSMINPYKEGEVECAWIQPIVLNQN